MVQYLKNHTILAPAHTVFWILGRIVIYVLETDHRTGNRCVETGLKFANGNCTHLFLCRTPIHTGLEKEKNTNTLLSVSAGHLGLADTDPPSTTVRYAIRQIHTVHVQMDA